MPETLPNDQDATISPARFSSFLLSPENAVFSDYGKSVWQDMTQPISDYYISSSHNTYLVGNQLVGVSTIEGYIRALLLSCRSVERTVFITHLHYIWLTTPQWTFTTEMMNP
jgi:phosphatidylinositol phospholipase C delta